MADFKSRMDQEIAAAKQRAEREEHERREDERALEDVREVTNPVMDRVILPVARRVAASLNHDGFGASAKRTKDGVDITVFRVDAALQRREAGNILLRGDTQGNIRVLDGAGFTPPDLARIVQNGSDEAMEGATTEAIEDSLVTVVRLVLSSRP